MTGPAEDARAGGDRDGATLTRIPEPRRTRAGGGATTATLSRPEPPAAPRPADTPPARPAPAAASKGSGWLLPLIVLIVGVFMSVLDTSITNVAIPRMQVDLSAAPRDVEWVVTAFTLALGISVPISGWLSERFGEARLYIYSMLGFALASALCGLAWDLPSMIAFRVLQAIPGAILPVVSLTLLYKVVPPGKIGAAMGIYGQGIVVAPAVGPVLGGWFVEYIDWRLIFFVNVPIGIAGTAAAMAVFPRDRPTSWPRFDVWGFVTSAYGLAALLLACSKGQDWGWGGYRIRGLVISGVLALALFVLVELEVRNPLIDMRIFANKVFGNALALLGIAVVGLFAMLYFLPLYLQNVQGEQALDAGLMLVPSAMILVVLMPITGRLYDRFGPRWLVLLGLVIMAWGSFLMAHMTVDTDRTDIAVWSTLRNLGVGLAMMPIFTAGMSALPSTLTGAASNMANVMQRVASSLAVAVFSSLSIAESAQIVNDRGMLLEVGGQALPGTASGVAQSLVPLTPQGSQATLAGTASVASSGSGGMAGAAGGAGLGTGATPSPPGGLIGLYQQLSTSALTQTYNNAYYVIGLLCLVGLPLALFLPTGRPATSDGPRHVEM